MDIEYRITLADGQTFYLTVTVRLNVSAEAGSPAALKAHREAINDGFLLATVKTQHAAFWPVNGELAKVEFYQVHPF
jgi:hypothetical protein